MKPVKMWLSALMCITVCQSAARAFQIKSFEHGHVRFPAETEMSEKDGEITLVKGTTLIDAVRDLSVKAGDVLIKIERGAVVLIKRDDEITEVVTLFARGKGDVHVFCGNRKVDVLEAEKLYVGPSAARVINWVRESPGHRRVIKSDVQEGSLTLLLIESPPVAILQGDELLRALKESDEAKDRRLYNKLVKMAACVTFVRSRRPR